MKSVIEQPNLVIRCQTSTLTLFQAQVFNFIMAARHLNAASRHPERSPAWEPCQGAVEGRLGAAFITRLPLTGEGHSGNSFPRSAWEWKTNPPARGWVCLAAPRPPQMDRSAWINRPLRPMLRMPGWRLIRPQASSTGLAQHAAPRVCGRKSVSPCQWHTIIQELTARRQKFTTYLFEILTFPPFGGYSFMPLTGEGYY